MKAFEELPWQKPDFSGAPDPGRFKAIAVIGIGGSSLGAKALTSALGKRAIIYIDNSDPDFVLTELKKLPLKSTLFMIISKSGETIETNSLAFLVYSKVKSPRNFVVITDSDTSALGAFARKRGIPVLRSPAKVPGRFSVLSVVGLFPAASSRINIAEVLAGARKASRARARTLAKMQYRHYKKGKNIAVIFPYSEALSAFSDWYIQLLAESIGKSKNIGITPIKAIGAKDQHSQLQLFLDGPDDKFFIFIKLKSGAPKTRIPNQRYTLQQLFDAEYRGVIGAFRKRKKPFIEIKIPKISAQTLGELLYFFEMEVAYLGDLFKVNTENQPAVELSKRITKHLIK